MTCIFCKIASGEVPTTLIYDDEHVVAFRDIRPQAPSHILIVPRKHIRSLWEFDDPQLGGAILVATARVARSAGLLKGFRVISNAGGHAGQEVEHLHFHVVGGAPLGPMLSESH